NPACTSSRNTLAILNARGLDPVVVEYLKTPLTKPELKTLAATLAKTPGWPGLRDGMMRVKEPVYTELALDGASDDALFAAMADHPILMNRPIVVTEKGARLCRPPELVEAVL
ncbi:MAG TPA: arsenate reductase (glutaredoxin), partial [Rhizomicrobium sp.]|nr:arsenate reductase (glutaredoxin) [Rhizomicrobium sp.]